jgi:transcriptional regulator with XRE-family HTH domain
LYVSLAIRRRLEELGLEQKGLARAAGVTESYVSQLLTGRKSPPVPSRTGIYAKMEKFLKLPAGDLSRLADVQHKEELKRALGEGPTPLFESVRELILRKCNQSRVRAVRTILEKQPFGELERLVTQKLLDVARSVAREQVGNAHWLRTVAQSDETEAEVRARVTEFLDGDIFRKTAADGVSFLEPLIESWDIDLATFDLTIVLNQTVPTEHVKQFGFIEIELEEAVMEEGLKEFLATPGLSATATAEEVEFLRKLRCGGRRPTALYYYRELQNLRDPLHFVAERSA